MWLEGFLDVELLGQGGVGDVYRARRASTGAPVAIKFLRPSAAGDVTVERELHALVGLQGHPNVVHVEEVVRLDEHFGLVMEYAPGGSVLDLMQSRGTNLSMSETILVGQQTASALADAHARGFIHRDVKPHNLLIGSFGQIKVCDFGIAAIAARDGLRTVPDALTPRYASPEELRNDPVITSATDVYSLGATLHHVLTGRYLVAPSSDDNSAVLAWWQPEQGADPTAADALRQLVRRSTALDPASRPTARDLADELDRLAFGLGEQRMRRLPLAGDQTVLGRGRTGASMAHARSLSSTDLSGRVVTGPPTGSNTGGRRRASPWLWVAAASVALAVVAAAIILFATAGTTDPPAEATDTERDDEPAPDDAGLNTSEDPASNAKEIDNPTVGTSEAGSTRHSIIPTATAVEFTTTTSSTTTTSTTTAPPTTTLPPEEAAHQQMNAYVEGDRATLASLSGMWLPQLSIKWLGVEDNGRVYTWSDILSDHNMFRLDKGAIVAFSDSVDTTRPDTFFTLVPVGSGSEAGVRAWCELNGYTWNETCLARRVLG